MAKIKQGRPAPSLKLSSTIGSATDPTSPPDTPTVRDHRQHPASRAPLYRFSRPLSQDPNIKPVGKSHAFSYQPSLGPERLSPRSSSSAADDDDLGLAASSAGLQHVDAHSLPASYAADVSGDGEPGSDDAEVDADSDPSGSGSDSGCDRDPDSWRSVVEVDFVIEDVDPMDSDCDGLEMLLPTEIESMRSRSRSRHKDLDTAMMQDLRNLNCSNEASDNDHEAFLQRRQELRRHRRVSMSSSFGKRTHSELSDDSDYDEAGSLDVNDVGSCARRMRKRLHRSSLLFQDPPEPRIDELEEPASSDDDDDEDYAADSCLARELPYYTMHIIEMESS